MDTLLAFAIACAVTLFFVRGYLRNLNAASQSQGRKNSSSAAATQPMGGACPRCSKPVTAGASFCASCGAPLALWRVHTAPVSQSQESSAEKGKPRPVINASLCIGCGKCVDACPEAGTLAVVGGKAILAQPESCIGHAKCIDACPTSAITLAFGGVRQTLKVPFVRENFETNVPGIFIVGELGGMGLIKTAINEGRIVIDHVRQRVRQNGHVKSNVHEHDVSHSPCPTVAHEELEGVADVLIVGAGPAGLSASLTAQQHGLRYITLEQGEVASTIRQYPRHKFLMAEPVEMPLYGSLYIADSTKEALVSVWENIIANTGVRVRINERVERVFREEEMFVTETSVGRYRAKQVVLAMGKRGTPRRLSVPGEDLSKVSYRLIEAETYSDNDILVVGGGDSALEAALALSRDKRNRVTLSYRKDTFERARERNQAAVMQGEGEGLLKVIRRSDVQEIRPGSVLLSSPEGPIELPNDFVFVMIGGESPEGFLRKTGIDIVEKCVSA
jgi:thioredoxin reductase/NAD-dependent dihydropyrimidine dehydrogenase PreA subunit